MRQPDGKDDGALTPQRLPKNKPIIAGKCFGLFILSLNNFKNNAQKWM